MCNCGTFGVPSEQIRLKGCLQSAIVPNSKQCPYRGFPEEFWQQIQAPTIKKTANIKITPSYIIRYLRRLTKAQKTFT